MAAPNLAASWRARAEDLERFAPSAAEAFRACAEELEQEIRARADQLVDQAEAARLSGLSTRRIRDLEAGGHLRNFGRKGAPRYRVGDLPVRRGPDRQGGGYDPEADADELLGRML